MRNWLTSAASQASRTFVFQGTKMFKFATIAASFVALSVSGAFAQEAPGGEANLKLPDLHSVTFFNGWDGHFLLLIGILFCVFGLGFGLAIYSKLKALPVHKAMLEISELIYETCKTYLVTQGKFLLFLWAFIAVIMVLYFGVLAPVHPVATTLPIILAFSLVGIAGSYGVAWFGIRVNTFANSRTAFASLGGKPYPIYRIPLAAGMSIGMMLISVELLIMLIILLFVPREYAGPCFIGFAIGESLGAAALRIAGGIFTKIADIGADLMKIVFKIKEDDARNPGVIADCTGDNAGDSVGPSADGFETYGVTGVALITFILLGVKSPTVQVQLLVWIFVMRVMMLVASAVAYFLNGVIAKARYEGKDEMNFESPLTSLVWITSFVSIGITYFISHLMIPDLGGDALAVVETGDHHLLRNSGGCGDSGVGQSIHLDRVAACEGSGDFGGRRRRIARNSFRLRGREFLGLLPWPGDGRPDGDRILGEHDGPGRSRQHDRGSSVCFWSGGIRIPGHGAGDDCRRFLRPSHGQRAIGVRAVAD